jgi:hypothetical protein
METSIAEGIENSATVGREELFLPKRYDTYRVIIRC